MKTDKKNILEKSNSQFVRDDELIKVIQKRSDRKQQQNFELLRFGSEYFF